MRRLLAIAAAALISGGCAAAPVETPQSAPITAVSLPGTAPARVPAEVPATLRFTGKTLDGADFDAAGMAGRPTILWFWAPWCATCASQAGSVTSVLQEYGDRLGILGIAGMGGNKEMHEFVSDLEVGGVRHLDDQAGVVWRKFGITEQSTYVLVDAAGRAVTTSYLDDQQLSAEVKTLVG